MIISEADHVTVEKVGPHVLLISMIRPEKRNALCNAMVLRIGATLAAAEKDLDIRAVVLTGVDSAFCAGADIAELSASGNKAANAPERVHAWGQIERFPKPLIAAVNGFAFGAGNELALTCDFIIAGSNALFGQPEVKIGGIPGDGGTQRLTRKIGPAFASYMMFTGDPIDAITALRVGHVVEVVDKAQTVVRAVEIATTIASRAPLAVQSIKACVKAAGDGTLDLGIAFERNEIWKLQNAPDAVEGGRSFLEKRPPRFTGRWDS
jgi:enoyl-CoA hydratase/carnithine racemase